MHAHNTLENCLIAGAAVRIDAKSVGINSLNQLVAVAHNNQAVLTVTNANHILKDSLERLATIGGQYIAFEF